MNKTMLMLVMGTGWVLVAYAAPDGTKLVETEPTITREENDWIRAAAAVAATNPVEAVALMAPRCGPRASPALDFALGNFHFQAGAESNAATAYQRALEKMPKFRSARVNLARLYLLQEQTGDAMALLRGVTEDGQGDADTYLLLGHTLLLTENPLSAETAYRQSLLLRPRDPDAFLGLARALLPQERVEESLAVADELLQRRPYQREIRALRANALMRLERPEEAASALEAARRLDLADAEMLATLGDLHLNAQRYDDAVSAYEQAFASEASSVARQFRAMEGFLMSRQPAAADRLRLLLDEALANIPDAFTEEQKRSLMRMKGDLALQQNEPEKARAHFEALLKLDPLDGRTLLRMGELHLQADRLEEAALVYERAARIAEVQADALVAHAQLEVQRERYAKAASLLEGAQALQPNERVGRYLAQVRRLSELEEAPSEK